MVEKIASLKKIPGARNINILDSSRAYAELKQIVEKEGIIDRDYTFYWLLMFITFAGMSLSLAIVLFVDSYLAIIFFGMVFAFFSVQVAGLFHDAGHKAIFESSAINDIFGNIFGGIVAMDFNAWKVKHDRHHAKPNQEGEDPDIELPLIYLTSETYQSKKGIIKLIGKFQVYYFLPMGLLMAFSPRLGSVAYFKREFSKGIWWEIALFALGFFVWFILPFFVFDFAKAIVLFLVVNGFIGIYLFNVFAPNHKGMPQLSKSVKLSFLEQQVITSRNIYGNWFNDFIYMGLNYQTEHHLFPHCPRNKLKLITPHLLAVCDKLKLDYTEVSPLESNKIILSELNAVTKN